MDITTFPAVSFEADVDVPVDVAMHLAREEDTAQELCRSLLAEGIPLSLLLDLVGLTAATSQDLAATERGDTSWVQRRLSA